MRVRRRRRPAAAARSLSRDGWMEQRDEAGGRTSEAAFLSLSLSLSLLRQMTTGVREARERERDTAKEMKREKAANGSHSLLNPAFAW